MRRKNDRQGDPWEGRDPALSGEPRLCGGREGHDRFGDGRQPDRQCEGHPDRPEQGDGKQNHGLRRIGMKTLKEVKCGETVTVAKLGGEGALKRRIMD